MSNYAGLLFRKRFGNFCSSFAAIFSPPAMQWAFLPLILALSLSACFFTFWPGKFLQ